MFARVAVAVLSLAASLALAGDEGNGNPVPYAAEAWVLSGNALVNETWSQPQFTGIGTQESSLAGLLQSSGSDTPVMTANSPPARDMDGMASYAGLRRRVPVTGAQVVVSINRSQHLS